MTCFSIDDDPKIKHFLLFDLHGKSLIFMIQSTYVMFQIQISVCCAEMC